MNEREHAEYVGLVGKQLQDRRYWEPVEDYINESAELCARRCELMRQFSLGNVDGWLGLCHDAEAIADEALQVVATRIVDAHIAARRRPPYAHPQLLARYPSGNVPDDEIHNWRQLEAA